MAGGGAESGAVTRGTAAGTTPAGRRSAGLVESTGGVGGGSIRTPCALSQARASDAGGESGWSFTIPEYNRMAARVSPSATARSASASAANAAYDPLGNSASSR